MNAIQTDNTDEIFDLAIKIVKGVMSGRRHPSHLAIPLAFLEDLQKNHTILISLRDIDGIINGTQVRTQ